MFNPSAVKTLIKLINAAIVLAPDAEWPRHGVCYELDHRATQVADKFAAENGLYIYWRSDWNIGDEDRAIATVLRPITPGMDHTGTIGGEIYTAIR